MNPKVSIVMPCFNAAGHLARSVGSVLAQGMADWELVVVDDGSTDDSLQVLESLAQQDERIRLVRQPNAGAAAARNRGLAASKGRFTAFLDSDDTWDPAFLGEMTGALEADPRAGIAYCGWQNIGLGGGRDKPYVPPDYEAGDKAEALLRCCPWPIHGALLRTELIRNTGGFDESLSTSEDFDLWLRLGTVHRLMRVPRVLAFYHHHGNGQITGNKAKVALNHWRAQQEYLVANPAVASRLGRPLIRKLTAGELLHHGYVAYWRRDLPAARAMFRAVMSQGYGGVKDWLYMLPAWLPERWHHRLLNVRDNSSQHVNDRP
jgi:glycosyltransferase involved in cell wall biosynthesis